MAASALSGLEIPDDTGDILVFRQIVFRPVRLRPLLIAVDFIERTNRSGNLWTVKVAKLPDSTDASLWFQRVLFFSKKCFHFWSHFRQSRLEIEVTFTRVPAE